MMVLDIFSASYSVYLALFIIVVPILKRIRLTFIGWKMFNIKRSFILIMTSAMTFHDKKGKKLKIFLKVQKHFCVSENVCNVVNIEHSRCNFVSLLVIVQYSCFFFYFLTIVTFNLNVVDLIGLKKKVKLLKVLKDFNKIHTKT